MMPYCRTWQPLHWLLLLAPASVVVATRESVTFDFGWKHRTGLTAPAKWDDPPPEQTDPGLHPPEAAPDHDDSSWTKVQLPHDGLIVNPPSQKACPNGCSGRSYIPRHVLWYRKTFSLPASWLSTAVDNNDSVFWLEFDGSFRNTTVWLNGQIVQRHICGYTPFRVDLDPSTFFTGSSSSSQQQTIAVFVDPDNGDLGRRGSGSGWWYEGGGLYRHVRLVKTNRIHVAPQSLFVKSHVTNIHNDNDGDKNNDKAEATLEMQASIIKKTQQQQSTTPIQAQNHCYQFQITAPDQITTLLEPHPLPTFQNPTDVLVVRENHTLPHALLWSTLHPNLYRVELILTYCSNATQEQDRVGVPHGIRTIHFDPNQGFFLNQRPYKIRGFCDHDTFAVVGMALPDRINLFRAQASRSIGGNGRRTSHNPPDPSLLDIYDRLGMVVIDENRLFDDHPDYVKNMAHLVTRDRNHPSVVIWSFCNENACEGEHEKGGPPFQAIASQFDGTRPTLANMFTFNDLLSNTVDVQGFSHQHRDKLDDCHAKLPNKPIFQSECCSCNTMRGEDEGCETGRDNPHSGCVQKTFNARCLERLVNASDGVAYAAGTMVWTLFDYYGEPPMAGLHVSSTYGQFDLCGFPKPAAFWFRTQWLLGVSDTSYDKPFLTHDSYEVQIVESWESPDSWNSTRGNKTRSIHAYSNAPFIELLANGHSQGAHPLVPMTRGSDGSYAEWTSVAWEAGSLTAVALSGDQSTHLAATERATNGKAASLSLSLDSPSEATGTGSALFLDGQDVALVRAAVMDEHGKAMHMASNLIFVKVVSGPGRVVGTANGDPKSYQPHQSPSQTAYHGLVRAVIQVTSIAGLSSREKQLLQEIHGPATESLPSFVDATEIVIEASSPGLGKAQLRIPVSADPSVASVLAVAQAGAGKPVDFSFDDTHTSSGPLKVG
ncbi:galactosidase BoGH2A [Seminavis robusta]|uniref:Galactosidase BoGH2A n=1 Tax=Seminavis robusta TaxID=568900 RepID=A0A9N8DZY2_9STRA|nr:galactosidase BoGH2A [Seminavis robusta]|eukprot:Sro513_g157720.1 galactosidase BoGH2A (938) ;mRNA; f:1214-4027